MSNSIADKAISLLEYIRRQSGEMIYFDELPAVIENTAVLISAESAVQKQITVETVKPVLESNISIPDTISNPVAQSKTETRPINHKPSIAFNPEINESERDQMKKRIAALVPDLAKTSTKVFNTNSVDADWKNAVSLDELKAKIEKCMSCPLGATRNKFVFGTGNPNSGILIIGEAPGNDEDMKGEPFVGRAGQLLTKILEAIKLSREEVYIANIIKCRPPANRRPAVEEVNQCEPYLHKQIEIIKPQFILALGLTAVDTLFKKPHKMGDIRGKIMDYHGIKTIATYHPAALLRNPNWKKFAWEDVQMLKAMYDEYLQSTK